MAETLDKSLLVRRFGDVVTLNFTCEIITPMFLGDAFKNASLRPEPFKALLRYWWRIAVGSTAGKDYSHDKLLIEEGKIFGSGGDTAQRSLITLKVLGNVRAEKGDLPEVERVNHPEVRIPIHPLLYLGYGPVSWDNNLHKAIFHRSYLLPGQVFTLRITIPKILLDKADAAIKETLFCFRAFGAIGSRSRNGWGSFQILDEISDYPKINGIELSKCFEDDRDYPHCLVKDGKGLLLWKSEGFTSWEMAMRFLAEVYIYLRTGFPGKHSWPYENSLDPDGEEIISVRHLLGFPLTNHPAEKAKWGEVKHDNKGRKKYKYKARLTSPLRFFIRKRDNKFYAFVLCLPYFLKSASIFVNRNEQLRLWSEICKRLDNAMKRADIHECL